MMIRRVLPTAVTKAVESALTATTIGPCLPFPPFFNVGPRLNSTNSFSHLDSAGRVRMVDVSPKSVTTRTATARAYVLMPPFVLTEVERQALKKGDVLTVAQIAGISGAKRTAELIPLCHNVPLSKVDISLSIWREGDVGERRNVCDSCEVSVDLDSTAPSRCGIEVIATAKTDAKTGVEMEALTGALVAALTVYDMCKALTKDMVITDAFLVEKSGGKADYRKAE